MVDLSIIIPVYKVERFIERCVRSLMEQTIKQGIEFIFIDDCSPDNSMFLLHRVIAEYPERAEQIRIITHKNNQGIATTRKDGILAAKGTYIGWCDSDDWCELDMYKKLYDYIIENNADFVSCNYYLESNVTEVCTSIYTCNKKDLLDKLYKKEHFFFPLVLTLIKRDILLSNDILPYEGVNIAEDVNILMRYLYFATKLVKIEAPLYHYEKKNDISITTTQYSDAIRLWNQTRHNIDKLCEFLQSKDKERYRKTCNYLKFFSKSNNSQYFRSILVSYNTYKESHRDILFFSSIPLLIRIKLSIVYSCYPIYWTYYKLMK